MKKSAAWQIFIFCFIADDGRHSVSVGAESLEDGVELITAMYSNVRSLRIIPKENQE